MNTDVKLTKREAEIAELLAWGASKCEIAARCFISERTVENHCRNIFEKVGVTKATELSAWWFCTSFHIPFSLSPLKRKLMAIILLALLIPEIIGMEQQVQMSNASVRTTRVCSRARRSRKNEPDTATFGFSN